MSWLSRIAIVAFGAVLGCGETTDPQITQKNLDRPVDIAFACYGGLRITHGEAPLETHELTTSAQPLESCAFRSRKRGVGEGPPPPPGQEDIGNSKVAAPDWYAFVLQSGPGTVAVARFDTKPTYSVVAGDNEVLDADPLTPGKNSISVGEDPIAIATDKLGCYEVVANAGSCDLSTVDIKTAVDAAFGTDVEPKVVRMNVTNASGQVIRARPAAMTFEPAGGVIGEFCPAQPTGLAYIAYPSCHLVAGVDVATGRIVTGVQFDAAGVPTVVDGNVSCPAECDGEPTTAGVRPVALDLERDDRTGRVTLAIGADNSHVLSVYSLDNQTMLPLSLSSIPLENTSGRLGLTSVAITPVIGMGGTSGVVIDDLAPGGEHQFVYAVATDGSVRVADIYSVPRECDTQVDPRFLADVRDVDLLSCLPVGGAATPPRRAGARGPGIELIGDSIPTSVDVSRSDALQPDSPDDRPAGTPSKLIGYFGLISSADGRVYIFQVDNDDFADFVPGSGAADELAAPIPLDIAHQLKDAIPERNKLSAAKDPNDTSMNPPDKFVCSGADPVIDSSGSTSGGPRLAANIQRTLPAGVIAPEKTGGLPSIRQVLCHDEIDLVDVPVSELAFAAPTDVRVAVFPDLRALSTDETWTLTYEGPLSTDRVDASVDGPQVRQGLLMVDGFGLHLQDASRPYCDAGVQPFDVVQLRGCDPSIGDAGCPIGYTCYVHPQSQVTGLGACMLIDEAERLSNACKMFLTSLRRYTVGKTKSGELQLLPRKTVLRTTPLGGCDTDAQCEMLADYAAQNGSSLNPVEPEQPTDAKTWRCLADTDRAPVTTGKRCLLVCSTDADCSFGTVCQANPAAAPNAGFCMEGVVPPQACVNSPQRYELRAGEAFAVVGNLQGFIHPIIADAADVCVKNPNAHPLDVGRIPLDPPDCDPAADLRTGRKMDGTYDANPCKVTVDETEYQLRYLPDTCTLDPVDDEDVVTRPATGLRFRNRAMTLTLVDPTYQGDLRCHGDRGGSLVDIPLVMPGYQLAFRQMAGFQPLRVVGIAPALPIKVVRGPNASFWIVDEGDFLSNSVATASTRGKVFRVEASRINVIGVLE